MTDKNFCMKLLLTAKEFNQIATDLMEEGSIDQSAIYEELSDMILTKYEDYKQKHNMT